MITREIKDLSYAFEALSRVPGTDTMCIRIQELIENKLTDLETKQTNEHPHHQTPPDDEIPF